MWKNKFVRFFMKVIERNFKTTNVILYMYYCYRDIHATDGDGKTCLHHASQSKAGLANSVVCTIVAHRPDMGKISEWKSDGFGINYCREFYICRKFQR